jgi:hypothetical protein
MYVKLVITDKKVREGEIGLYEELVDERFAPAGHRVFLDIPKPTKSLDAIRKKMQGEKLNEEELLGIMQDIGSRRLRETEVAFFVGTFFNPGFEDDEIYWMTKVWHILEKCLTLRVVYKKKKMVVDKHSIGGTAGKGITQSWCLCLLLMILYVQIHLLEQLHLLLVLVIFWKCHASSFVQKRKYMR